MDFLDARIRHYKQTGEKWNTDTAYLLRLYFELGACHRVADVVCCSPDTVRPIIRPYVDMDVGQNRRGTGKVQSKLNNMIKDLGRDKIKTMTYLEIADYLDHPAKSTGQLLWYHGVKYKHLRGINT